MRVRVRDSLTRGYAVLERDVEGARGPSASPRQFNFAARRLQQRIPPDVYVSPTDVPTRWVCSLCAKHQRSQLTYGSLLDPLDASPHSASVRSATRSTTRRVATCSPTTVSVWNSLDIFSPHTHTHTHTHTLLRLGDARRRALAKQAEPAARPSRFRTVGVRSTAPGASLFFKLLAGPSHTHAGIETEWPCERSWATDTPPNWNSPSAAAEENIIAHRPAGDGRMDQPGMILAGFAI